MAEARESVSVVVTTYNQPTTLVLVLTALARQTHLPDEVVVADDGSRDDTLAALAEVAPGLPFRVVHVWQPDEGFRAARSRNNAIAIAEYPVVAFLDQDVLPFHDWLAAWHASLRHGTVCLGDAVGLSIPDATTLSVAHVREGTFEGWCRPDALARRQQKSVFYAFLRRVGIGIKHKPALRSGNFAIHAAALWAVNGFDERYEGWGQEDDDLGRRLYGYGIRPCPCLLTARAGHIPHALRRDKAWTAGANTGRHRRGAERLRCRAGLDGRPYADVSITRL